MRRFNPEKELKKIQHGNRNKVILGVLLLLITLGISSSYALYQVRYSKRIIYMKVAPFSSKDIELAVKVDGQDGTLDHFPNKDEGLIYSGIECDTEGITTATWNYGTWSLDLNSTGPNKCTVTFKKGTLPTLSSLCTGDMPLNECIREHGLEVPSIVKDESIHHNLRYVGRKIYANNFIWYNCKSYDGLTESNATDTTHDCELWRIIGVMPVVETTSGKYLIENLVKIVRQYDVASKQWHTSSVNRWASASLNTGFLNKTTSGGYLYANYKDATYDWNIVHGITAASKAMIQKVMWNLGGTPSDDLTASQFYEAERSSTIPSGGAATYNGLIGLIYPSDYGYATSGGSVYSRQECLDIPLRDWSNSTSDDVRMDCDFSSWLSISGWTLTANTSGSSEAFLVSQGGALHSTYTTTSYSVYPTLYLLSSVKIKSGVGDGSEDNPYILIP